MTTVIRQTKETQVRAALGDTVRSDTGLAFFDHMLTTFGTYAGLAWQVQARGDLRHHLMEDVALTLGRLVREATPTTARRYGERTVPMDDALVQAVVDVGGRPYFEGRLPSKLYAHWFRSFAQTAGLTLHLRRLRGSDRHHVIEAAFKATGLALRDALELGSEGTVFSTKGSVNWDVNP
jgi:imidazoleglycerol-phosphate dehydratase